MKSKETKIRRGIVIFCVVFLILILFFCYRVMFWSDRHKEERQISVVLYEAGNDAWTCLQLGMKRAEEDFDVKIKYIMLSADASAVEQLIALQQELEQGAKGIVVAVTDWSGWQEIYADQVFLVPIVAVESGFGQGTVPCISADAYEMGKRLGEQILKDFEQKEKPLTIALAPNDEKTESLQQRQAGLKDACGEQATFIPLRVVLNGESADVAVGLDKQSLLTLANADSPALRAVKKYGIGNTDQIVTALSQKRIERLVFQNEFNMGYLAVKALVKKDKDGHAKELQQMDIYCVGSDEIYDPPYEQLLFPIRE